MPQILCELRLPSQTLERIAALPGVQLLDVIEQHEDDWDMTPGPEILLCKRPPRDVTGLKWVQFGTVGYDHLRERGFADMPLVLTNARGTFDSAIAEWNVCMMVALVRDLRSMLRYQERGEWHKTTRYGDDIRGRIVGLWGYGGIGRETARLARALGMTVHVLTRGPLAPRRDAFTPRDTGDVEGVLPHHRFGYDARFEFLAGLDFLILALPHTKLSDGLIGPAEFEALNRHAFLLNPARGPIVQEAALIDALQRERIAGAALDTHFAYPLPPEHPLWKLPNVILTPHVSGSDRASGFGERMAELCETNLRHWLAGEPLLNRVTRREWLET